MALHGYGRCAVCGAYVAARIPKGGDGSLFVPYYHKKAGAGNWTAAMIPCPGRDKEIIMDQNKGA